MYKAAVAQWILSRVSTPEQAESTVGDCLEQAETRGDFWFWRTVFRIALSLLPRAIAYPPMRTIRVVERVADLLVFFSVIWLFIGKGWRGFLIISLILFAWELIRAIAFRFDETPAPRSGRQTRTSSK